MQRQRKKYHGQHAGLAAALIITIGLITLLYVLFLPPADRVALLEGSSSIQGTGSVSPLQEVLLDEQPGRLAALREPSIRHRLNDAYLTSSREDRILLDRQDILLLSTYRDERPAVLPLRTRGSGRLERAILVLEDVEAIKGRPLLTVLIDGTPITTKRVGGSIRSLTIPLPQDILTESTEHTLTLRISPPPWYAFWEQREVRIGTLKSFGRVVDEQTASTLQTVSLADEEISQLRTAYLSLIIQCQDAPRLFQVDVNGETLLSTGVRCGSPLRIDIPPSSLSVGENTVWMRVYDGQARIDSPMLVTVLKEPIQPVYYFRIDRAAWDDIQQGRRRIILRIEFPRFTPGSVDVSVNGRPRYAARESSTLDITRDVREGENYIQLVPRRESEITRLQIILQDASS